MARQKDRGRQSNIRPPDLACTLTPFRPAQMTAAETCPELSGTTTTAGLTGRRRFIVVLYCAQSESHRTLNGTPLAFKHCSSAALEQLQEPFVFFPKTLEPRAATRRKGEMCMVMTRRTGESGMREVFGQRIVRRPLPMKSQARSLYSGCIAGEACTEHTATTAARPEIARLPHLGLRYVPG